jgi:hypothetical protein
MREKEPSWQALGKVRARELFNVQWLVCLICLAIVTDYLLG